MFSNLTIPKQSLVGLLGAFAALIVLTFIYACWQWSTDWELAHASAPSISAKTDDTEELINSIPNAHLFGKSFEKLGEVPVTNLQLRVTGIDKVDADDTLSRVYLSISGGPSKIYGVGDALPDGVRIYAITPDTVILENDGRLEKLPLTRPQLEFKPKNTEELP